MEILTNIKMWLSAKRKPIEKERLHRRLLP